MTGAIDHGEPVTVAAVAAEAFRAVNHLILASPAFACPGWEDVTDLYGVLVEVRLLAGRLPQLFDQLAHDLLLEEARGRCRSDSPSPPASAVLVAEAVHGLQWTDRECRAVACTSRSRSRRCLTSHRLRRWLPVTGSG